MIIFFGTDGGGVIVTPEGVKPFPGWGPEAVSELSHALRVIREASQLKTPGLADRAIKSVMDFTQKELGKHMKNGGVFVLG
jgi:hypothetical protein